MVSLAIIIFYFVSFSRIRHQESGGQVVVVHGLNKKIRSA